MIDALAIATSGLRTEQTFIDVISNNVVNMNTPGFKKGRVTFSDVAYANGVMRNLPADASPSSQLVGAGTTVASTQAIFSDGDMRMTRNAKDLAISGEGFFEVRTASGSPAYTRAGQLKMDGEGYLATVDGSRLSGDIQIPPDATKLKVAGDGTVSVHLTGQNDPVTIGRIQLARFTNPDGLKPTGNNQFEATRDSGQAYYSEPGTDGAGTLKQGYLEGSNVDMVDEMTNLVLAQRAYQLNARLIQAADQVLETINNLRR
jgi:flagellar basal-body rod protein FlgG